MDPLSSVRRTPVHALVTGYAILIGAACEPAPPPVVGISTSTQFMNAARLAVSEAEEAGRVPVDTVLIPERSNESAPAVRAAGRFVAVPGMVAVIGHSNSAASLAASQIYNERGIVQIAPHSSAVVYSRAGPWSFRLVPPDDAQAAFLASQLDGFLPGGGDLAVLYVNDDYGRGLLADLTVSLDHDRFRVVLEYPHTEEEGLRPEIVESTVTALADADPDLLVFLGRASILNGYLPLIRQRAPDLPVVGADGIAAGAGLPDRAAGWGGVHYVDFVDLDGTPALRDFSRRYEERFEVAATGPDALTYDATDLVLRAVDEGARTPAEVRAWLMSLGRDRPPHQGITGPIHFDEAGDVTRSYVLSRVGGEE